VELSTSGSYVSTATTGPRAFSVIASIGTNDGVNVISGGGDVLSYTV
jgi:poly(3-hydroxybutyrate) depolymerase